MRGRPRRPTIQTALAGLVLALSAATALAAPSYRLDLTVDWETGTYAGTIAVEFENSRAEPLDRLILQLFANDPAIYGDAEVRVLAAALDGIELDVDPQTEASRLPLRLSDPIAAGQTASLVAQFAGTAAPSPSSSTPAESGYGILTKNEDSFVLTSFYPMLAVDGAAFADAECTSGDRLWGEAADYDVTLRTKSGLVPASTGALLSSQHEDGHSTHRFSASSSRDFSLVLTRGYPESELQSGSLTLRSHFAPSDPGAAVRALEVAIGAVEIFERRIGALPHREIEIVEVPLQRVAGVEFTGLILVSEDYARRPADTFYDIIVSHEMAHQWFFAVVGNDPIASPWLDESLATFLSNIYLEESGQPDDALSERERWQRSYEGGRRAVDAMAIDSSACAFPSSSTYSSHVYDGGAWFLHSLRSEIGEAAFFEALSTYYADFSGAVATSRDLLSAFEAACSCELGALFDDFGFPTD
jgi:hypothetical protein